MVRYMATRRITVRHWLPIITFCPVNSLPDVVYVSLEFTNQFVELYEVRRKVRKLLAWRKLFMEDAAAELRLAFPNADAVEVHLAFNRHVVRQESDYVVHQEVQLHAPAIPIDKNILSRLFGRFSAVEGRQPL